MLRSSKPPKCKVCRQRTDGLPIHHECVEEFVRIQREKKARNLEKAHKEIRRKERATDKERKEAVKSARELKPEAQDSFNAYIRYRDRHLPCVSCGETNPPMTSGGQWDAGHFLSRGSHPELAFDEDNCWRQCKSCNGGSAYTKANERVVSARYEEELLRRIGPERLARLKGPHPPAKRTADDFRALRDHYRGLLREMKKQNEE